MNGRQTLLKPQALKTAPFMRASWSFSLVTTTLSQTSSHKQEHEDGTEVTL